MASLTLGPDDIVALTAASEARRLSAQCELWPGWAVGDMPVLYVRRGWRMLLVGHPDPPPGFEGCDFAPEGGRATKGPVAAADCRVPWIPGSSGALELEHGGAIELNGRPTAAVPYPVAGASAPGRVAQLAAATCGAAFCAFVAGRVDRAWGAAAGPLPDYAGLQPVNNALGNLEGLILHDALWGAEGGHGAAATAAAAEAATAARALVLVRRERRQNMDDRVIADEQRSELVVGLAAYVAARAAQAAQTGQSAPAGCAVSGWQKALREVNCRGQGATYGRFRLTGMALAFLLDRLGEEWHDAATQGTPLDNLVEQRVKLDGGSGDDGALAAAQRRHGYLERLDEERAFVRGEQERRREQLSDLLFPRIGEGQKMVFDVEHLRLQGMAWLESALCQVSDSVAIHGGPLALDFGHALLSFDGPPVAVDLQQGLVHVSLPGRALRTSGDGEDFVIEHGAEFTDGLEVDCRGVYAKAGRGTVFNVDGELLISLRRPPAVWRRKRPGGSRADGPGTAPGGDAP